MCGKLIFFGGCRGLKKRSFRVCNNVDIGTLWVLDDCGRCPPYGCFFGGKPCMRGLRITVYEVLEYLASEMTEAEILDDFPDLT